MSDSSAIPIMPKLGVCTSVANAAAAKKAGFDYIEESVQGLLHAHDQAADQWHGGDQAAGSDLPVPCANLMVPAAYKVTGPDVDAKRLATYMQIVLSRAQRVGIRTIVFGSGGARQVPPGWDPKRAADQIVSFLRSIAPVADERDVTIVVEPLNSSETNILNTVPESAEIVKRVDHGAVRLLWDTYHIWKDAEAIEALPGTFSLLKHVHVADLEGRVGPGLSGKSNYRPIFQILKQNAYRGRVSVETPSFDIAADGAKVVQYLRDEWRAA